MDAACWVEYLKQQGDGRPCVACIHDGCAWAEAQVGKACAEPCMACVDGGHGRAESQRARRSMKENLSSQNNSSIRKGRQMGWRGRATRQERGWRAGKEWGAYGTRGKGKVLQSAA